MVWYGVAWFMMVHSQQYMVWYILAYPNPFAVQCYGQGVFRYEKLK